MAAIVVVGGGIGGGAAALLLARDGHSVTVIDQDPGPLPADVDEAWETWSRRSVNQFRMAHLLLTRGSSILEHELPDVHRRLAAARGLRLNLVDAALAASPEAAREPGDDRHDLLTGRRPTIEWALAATLDAEPAVTVRRGAAVAGLVAGPRVEPETAHVVGVHLEGGEELPADLVVDATGRNSPTLRWLADLGGSEPREDSEDSGFAYYGRFFRSADGSVPELRAPLLTPIGSMSVLTIPSDGGTWSTTLYAAADDAPLRRLRDPRVFEAVVRECPHHAHWVDGEPISEVRAMVGVADRTRSFVVDGRPVVTGMLSIADAAACSNPSIGRGMTFALLHTLILREAVRDHLDDPLDLATEFGRRTESELGPWHEATRQNDRARVEEMRMAASREVVEPTPWQQAVTGFGAAAQVDPTVARALAEIQGCLTPADEVLARPGLLEHALEVAASLPPVTFGPDRRRLLELVG